MTSPKREQSTAASWFRTGIAVLSCVGILFSLSIRAGYADDELMAQAPDPAPANVLMPSSSATSASSTTPQLPDPGFTAQDIAGDHEQNATIDLGPFHAAPLIQIGKLRPIRLDASFTEPLSLRDALNYTVRNNLPIRINERTYANQKYQFYNALAGYLPSITNNLTFSHSNIGTDTVSNSRVFSTSLSFPVFQGGAITYGALLQYYRMHAARNQYATSINDALLNTYNAYYNLLLQRALLQIRIKSVEVSETQLRLNQQLYMAGTGTKFAVMQSQTQLALDRQALLQQQFNMRIAALQLGYTMNMPLAANLVPMDSVVKESDLYEDALRINDLLTLSFKFRPELRQYEYLRIAAQRSVQLASSQLYPTLSFSITYQASSTSVSGGGGRGGGGGGGRNAGGLAAANGFIPGGISSSGFNAGPAVGVTTAGVPNVSGTPLQVAQLQTGTGGITVTPGSSNTTFGTATGATQTGGSGSTVVTSGSGLNTVSGVFAGQSPLIGNVGTAVGAFGGKVSSISMGFNLNWQLRNLGVAATTGILQARTIARQALLQANQVFQQVVQQTRSSYLTALAAHEQIDVTAASVAATGEALRLANLRVQHGIGTNLELIQAQRDYIQALITQAQAIIASNQAQAQLLHDTGVISVDTLTNGYHRTIGLKPFKKNQTY